MTDLRIESTEKVTDRISLFTLVSASGEALPGYAPGAHIDFDLGEAGTRSYSLVNFASPGAAPTSYRVAVQREDEGKGGSQKMHALKAGDTVSTTDPKNDFALHDGDAPALLIAGGIGVTPIISFGTELQARGGTFAFHYAVRSADVLPFGDRLKAQFGDTLTLWYDDQQMIKLGDIVGAAAPETHIYCCGPRGMIDAVREVAEAKGFPNDQIHFELFTSPTTEVGDQSFEVEIGDGRVFEIPPGKTIIEVLEENDVDVMYDCARGDCGICQTDIISGTPDHRDVVLSDAERAEGKVMQICVSRALSERLVLDI